MPGQPAAREGIDLAKAAAILRECWEQVTSDLEKQKNLRYVDDDEHCKTIRSSINHLWVSYRFCLPTQLLGKLANPLVDCLRLQRQKDDTRDVRGWDARSLASKVVAPFNAEQESVLGTSSDPYVGNPMRIPRMACDDKSKKDIPGWNRMVELLEAIEAADAPKATRQYLCQALLEMLHRQQGLRFTYPIPPRASLEATLRVCESFLSEKSGGDRALAVTGALFQAIGRHFGLFKSVERAKINASDAATGMAADLECLDSGDKLILTVEVKDRQLTLTDVQGTLHKSRQRGVKNIFFTAKGTQAGDSQAIEDRIEQAFASGQNLYVFGFAELARSVLALGGEEIRATFLKQIGEHLDAWNTQPKHRQAWQKMLKEM